MEQSDPQYSLSPRSEIMSTDEMNPAQSLAAIEQILLRLTLPVVAEEGQLSHSIIAGHVQTIREALVQSVEDK